MCNVHYHEMRSELIVSFSKKKLAATDSTLFLNEVEIVAAIHNKLKMRNKRVEMIFYKRKWEKPLHILHDLVTWNHAVDESFVVTFASIILTSSWSCCVRSFASTCTRSVYSWPSCVCRNFLPITTLVLHPCILSNGYKHFCHLKNSEILFIILIDIMRHNSFTIICYFIIQLWLIVKYKTLDCLPQSLWQRI